MVNLRVKNTPPIDHIFLHKIVKKVGEKIQNLCCIFIRKIYTLNKFSTTHSCTSKKVT